MTRSAWLCRLTALAQSVRCTETPRPRVTKPMISSPGHRRAAPREAHHHVVEAFDVHTAPSRAAGCGPAGGRCTVTGQLLLAAAQLAAARAARPPWPRRGPRRSRRAAPRGRRSSASRRPTRARGELVSFCTGSPSRRSALTSSSRARVDRVDAPLAREPLPDLRAGARRLHELQPVAARARALDLAREDLARVARLQRGVERHQPPVDARADAAVPDLGVDRVREVDRRARRSAA